MEFTKIMPQSMHPSIKLRKKILFACSAIFLSGVVSAADGNAQQSSLCSQSAGLMNNNFVTLKGLDINGDLPLDSGLIVHTIHGPGTTPSELDMKALNALPVDASKTCGAFMNMSPPVFLPWCGSNKDPITNRWDDSSSWTYLRLDTLINGRNSQRPDEVVCSNTDNKKYGLIFSNVYMNQSGNLGCMYPLDGDTGNRIKMGCGVTQNPGIVKTDAQGACPASEDVAQYTADFNNLLTDDSGQYASYAGSLICSLSKSQFDTWVAARKNIDLSSTAWPVNEFVLFNWDTYSTSALAKNNVITGVYYLTGCASASDGNRADAQAIADLYRKWSGVDLPVFNLSNSDMRANGRTPFSCK
jgi:hypothetical protein